MGRGEGRVVRAGRAAGSHRARGEVREWGEPGAEAWVKQ